MNSNGHPMDEFGRKLHLDALFADEPYLSPTMKARQMHEKMEEQRENQSGVSLPPARGIEGIVASQSMSTSSGSSISKRTTGVPKMNFDEARAILRGHGVPDKYGFDPSDPLSYFRTQVLSIWLEKVEPREINRPDPTFVLNSSAATLGRGDNHDIDELKG